MKYILNNNQWEVTYTDSQGTEHTFQHPIQVLDNVKYIETGERHMMDITEETIREIFPTDSFSEERLNYMNLNGIVFGDAPKD